jgi:hypothetical protein
MDSPLHDVIKAPVEIKSSKMPVVVKVEKVAAFSTVKVEKLQAPVEITTEQEELPENGDEFLRGPSDDEFSETSSIDEMFGDVRSPVYERRQ